MQVEMSPGKYDVLSLSWRKYGVLSNTRDIASFDMKMSATYSLTLKDQFHYWIE